LPMFYPEALIFGAHDQGAHRAGARCGGTEGLSVCPAMQMNDGNDNQAHPAISRRVAWTEQRVLQLLAAGRSAITAGRVDEASGLLDDEAVAAVLAWAYEDSARAGLVLELAELLSRAGRDGQAEHCCHSLLARPGGPRGAAYNKLGCLCQYSGRMSEAVDYHRKAVEAEPQSPQLWANLARVLMETGRMGEGMELLRKAITRMPGNAQAHSNYLFRLHQMPQLDQEQLFNEHRQWGRTHAPPSLAQNSHENTPDPDRRLRVGYISPDFRRHSVSYFFESLLDGHNRDHIEVCGYGNVEFQDQVTERLKGKFDRYRDVWGMSDQAVAELIRADGIDILVDLAGHAGENRLRVLARKPAPLQVTYLGYPDTTGVDAVDYRLTDAWADSDESARFHTEELVFLPDGFLCYKPPDFAGPVSPLPAQDRGYVTFGSFNNNSKINPPLVRLWAQVLDATGNSRLLLKLKGGDEPDIRNLYLEQFDAAGLSRDRVEICGWKSPHEHLKMYDLVDIALDTYPYCGTTTTCEALWMGVPVVSLVGLCHASRVGLSILTRVGLEFFAASTRPEYVAKAAALAANLPALAQIRASMRARIATSGLCHARAFARTVEHAYRRMWHQWCHGRGRAARRRAESEHRTRAMQGTI